MNLGFYDHSRQSYSELAIEEAGEFMIGGYDKTESGVDQRGEFKVELVDLDSNGLLPRLRVFGDATAALMEAIGMGLLECMIPVASSDLFSARLIHAGFVDCSDKPLEGICPRCGQEQS